MEDKYLPVGTIIELPFAKLKVVENKDWGSNSCSHCFFDCFCADRFVDAFGTCISSFREDSANVYFELLKEDNI